MREIVFDTETTGFEPRDGHRLVELGCVELINHVRTGKYFHKYLNPQREVPPDATKVHGLTNEFLQDKPLFADVAADFLAFIGEAPLVIHNAAFDMKFINAELGALGREPIPFERAIDTLMMARRKHPGAPASLDALCKRYGIDNTSRDKHGALLDAELLADVYLQLIGGRQQGLSLAQQSEQPDGGEVIIRPNGPRREPRPHAASDQELAAHTDFLKGIKNAIWLRGAGRE